MVCVCVYGVRVWCVWCVHVWCVCVCLCVCLCVRVWCVWCVCVCVCVCCRKQEMPTFTKCSVLVVMFVAIETMMTLTWVSTGQVDTVRIGVALCYSCLTFIHIYKQTAQFVTFVHPSWKICVSHLVDKCSNMYLLWTKNT